MLFVFNTLAPVLSLILVGALLQRLRFLSLAAFSDINRLTYWIGVPSLLFLKIGTTRPDFAAVADLLSVTLGATVLGMLLAWITGALLRLPGSSLGVLVQAAFRGNLAFVGLPLVIYAFEGRDAAVEATTLTVLGPMVVLYNVAAVSVLLLSSQRPSKKVILQSLRGMVSNPILLSCLAGVLWSVGGPEMPLWIQRSLAAMGQMALPLALMCIGAALAASRLRGNLHVSLLASGFKVAVLPLLGLGLAYMVGLDGAARQIALLLLASPTAAASYVLVRQLGGDEALASAAVLCSALMSIPVLALVLAWSA